MKTQSLGKNNVSKFLTILFIVIISFTINNLSIAGGLKVLHEKTFNVSKGELLELYADVGDVKIESWEKDELYVKVLGNSKAEDKLDFEFERTDKGVKIVAEREGSSWFSWFSSIDLKFEIKMPSDFDSYVKTAGGDISFTGITGSSDLKTSGGDINIFSSGGDLLVKTSGGDIELTSHNGDADLNTSGGDIQTTRLNGSLDAGTSGGDMRLDVSNGAVSAGTSGGDITLNYAGSNMGISLKTSGGDIRLYAPPDFQANVELKTSGGDITCNFSSTRANKISSSRFEAELNGGGNLVKCTTSGGDIIMKEVSN